MGLDCYNVIHLIAESLDHCFVGIHADALQNTFERTCGLTAYKLYIFLSLMHLHFITATCYVPEDYVRHRVTVLVLLTIQEMHLTFAYTLIPLSVTREGRLEKVRNVSLKGPLLRSAKYIARPIADCMGIPL